MNMIRRTIVSALITTSDNKVLFGKKDSQRGGVYLDKWHIPGGGIENDEQQLDTLKREVMEETGIDIKTANITLIDNLGSAVTPKKMPSGEIVPCQMEFLVYKVELSEKSEQVKMMPGDDFAQLQWVPIDKVNEYPLTPPSVSLFLRIGWLNAKQALTQRQFTDADQEPISYSQQELTWRVSAYALVVKDGKLLIIKNKLEKLHDIIGGGIEFGETIEDALHREAMEEGGVKIKIGKLLGTALDWFYHKKGTYHQTLQLFYLAELSGELNSPTDLDIEWVGFVNLDEIGTKYHLPPVVENVITNTFINK